MIKEVPVAALTEEQAREDLARLATLIAEANVAYHGNDAPDLTDADYDALKKRNAAIEVRFPNIKRSDSPSDMVGSAPSDGFGKIKHDVRMLSLENAFDPADITDFDDRVRKFLGATGQLSYTAEPKIDGLSLSLRYVNGRLTQAATRGDGEVGENVTENARTIFDIPQQLRGENIPSLMDIRGEVYMSHADFAALNRSEERRVGKEC